jgi:hypothetical protein
MSLDSTVIPLAAMASTLGGVYLRTSLRSYADMLSGMYRRYIQSVRQRLATAISGLTDTVLSPSGLEYPRLAAMGLVEPILVQEIERVPITVAVRR